MKRTSAVCLSLLAGLVPTVAHGALINTVGQTQALRPGLDLNINVTEQANQRFLREVDQLSLPGGGLAVDILTTPGQVLNNSTNAGYPAAAPIIPAGTVVNSHYIHFDPVGSPAAATSATATYTFDSQILAVILSNEDIPGPSDNLLNLSDSILGFGSTTYNNQPGRRTLRTTENTDLITLSADGKSITITQVVTAGNIDGMRIITASNGLAVPSLEYNAALSDAGTLIVDTVRKIDAPNLDWDNNGVTKTTNLGSTSYQNVFATFQLNGTDSIALLETNDDDFETNYPGNPTDGSASFEVLFRPNDLSGQEVIYEFGGSGDGTSLTLNGSVLQLVARDNAITAGISTDITPVAGDFIHAVGVIDLGSDLLSLYVNGELVLTTAFSGDATDWSGANGDGLGARVGTEVGGTGATFGVLNGYGTLQGDLAIFRFYEQTLNAAQVGAIFQSLVGENAVPEPASLSLLALAALGLARRRRVQ